MPNVNQKGVRSIRLLLRSLHNLKPEIGGKSSHLLRQECFLLSQEQVTNKVPSILTPDVSADYDIVSTEKNN